MRYRGTGMLGEVQRLIDKSLMPGIGMAQIEFKGYDAVDFECKYCLHYGGKSKGCLINECCCLEEKQQSTVTAVKYMEEKI